MTIKYFVRRLAGLLVCGVSAFVAYSILNYGENGFNASEICQLVAVLSIVIGVASVFSPNTSVKDRIISCIVFIAIGSIVSALDLSDQNLISNLLVGVILILYGLSNFIYYLGNVKGQMRAKCCVVSNIGQLLIALFTFANGGFEMLFAAGFVEDPSLIAIVMNIVFYGLIASGLLAGGFLVYDIVTVGFKKKNRAKAAKESSAPSHVDAQSAEPKDYRAKDRSSFSSLLNDKLNSICRWNSLEYDLNKGSVNLDIAYKNSNGHIPFILTGTVQATDVKDTYDASALPGSLTSKLDTIGQNLIRDAESAIEKLRENYQNYDGEFDISVEQGKIKI